MAIPYQTAKFNIFGMVIWGPTAKFNSRQYFQLYSIIKGLSIYLVTATHNFLNSYLALPCTIFKIASTIISQIGLKCV